MNPLGDSRCLHSVPSLISVENEAQRQAASVSERIAPGLRPSLGRKGRGPGRFHLPPHLTSADTLKPSPHHQLSLARPTPLKPGHHHVGILLIRLLDKNVEIAEWRLRLWCDHRNALAGSGPETDGKAIGNASRHCKNSYGGEFKCAWSFLQLLSFSPSRHTQAPPLDSGAKRNVLKRSGFERPFQARQSRPGRAS
jgi:hypothetical protein